MDAEKPTEMQLQLAAKLPIENASSMTRGQLSRTFAKMLGFVDDDGETIEKIDAAIDSINPNCQYALTLYQRGKKQIVDVLQFEDLQYDDKDRIFLECVVPVIDRSDGPAHHVPEWDDKTIDITIDKLLFYRALPANFADKCQDSFSMDHYRKTVAGGVKHVRTIMGIEPDVNPIAVPKEPQSAKARKPSERSRPVVEKKSTGCLSLLIGIAVSLWIGITVAA